MSCPICNGKLKITKAEYSFYDVPFGKFDAEVCQKCGEVFFTEEASDEIDGIAKKKGLWGLEKRSKISIEFDKGELQGISELINKKLKK